MPDAKYCGGVLALKEIAALVEGAGLLVAPHGPGSPVGNVVSAHVCVTIPNFHILAGDLVRGSALAREPH